MSRQIPRNSGAFAIFLILIIFIEFTRCTTRISNNELGSFPSTRNILITPDSNRIANLEVALPPSTFDLFACIKCHQGLKVNTKMRVLGGTHLNFVFDHPGYNTKNRWCYSCHNTVTYDSLRLETGKLLSYQKSYELCVQCHVINYREWELGIHGRRTGMWNGGKQYLSCIYCHNPHSPKYKPVEPMKPPLKPF